MSWAPLCGDEPIEGEPGAVRAYGQGLVRTADRIARQAGDLRRLASTDGWEAETADAFRDQAEDLAEEIEKAEERYRTVGGLVKEWAQALDDARRAAAALRDDAQEQQRILDRTPEAGPEEPGPDAPPGTLPAMTPEGLAQNARRRAAEREIEDLRGALGRLVDHHEERGKEIGQRIRGALDDGLNDRWQDRLKAWIANHADVLSEIAKWAGRIAAVVGIIALFCTPFGWVALAAALVAVVASGALAMTGDGSWLDVGLNVVGALSLGLGAFMTRGVIAAFRGGRGLLATQAGSATRASLLNAVDGPVGGMLGRIPLVGGVVRGTQAATRTVLAPAAARLRYLSIRFAPLEAPRKLHVLAYSGRKFAAIRLEALRWVDEGGEVAAYGEQILRTGVISGTNFVPYVTIPGAVATGTSSARDLLDNNPWFEPSR
jgi:uncharacterized protein YukE